MTKCYAGVNLYQHVALILRERITSGQIPYGATVPGEIDLMTMFGISRITARRALGELARAGLVRRKRKVGTVVTYLPPRSPVRVSIVGLLDDVLKIGIRTGIALKHFEYCPAPAPVAEALEVEAGTTVQHVVRVRTMDRQPFSHITTWVPERIGRTYTREDLMATPMLVLFQRANVAIQQADQTVEATLAEPDVAAHLGVQTGSPLLRISRIVRGDENAPIQFIVGRYHPYRYAYRMSFSNTPLDDVDVPQAAIAG